jgi:hypothetical protein
MISVSPFSFKISTDTIYPPRKVPLESHQEFHQPCLVHFMFPHTSSCVSTPCYVYTELVFSPANLGRLALPASPAGTWGQDPGFLPLEARDTPSRPSWAPSPCEILHTVHVSWLVIEDLVEDSEAPGGWAHI